MKSLLIELIELYKERKEYKRDYRKLCRSNIDYAALQNMVDIVSTKNVVIELMTSDGVKMTIRPKENNAIGYESFHDKFARNRGEA